MYQDYDRAANQVINHLTKRHCASSIIYMNKRCFRLFKEYMIEKNIEYSYMPSVSVAHASAKAWKLGLNLHAKSSGLAKVEFSAILLQEDPRSINQHLRC